MQLKPFFPNGTPGAVLISKYWILTNSSTSTIEVRPYSSIREHATNANGIVHWNCLFAEDSECF
jgi:hypothetical protein